MPSLLKKIHNVSKNVNDYQNNSVTSRIYVKPVTHTKIPNLVLSSNNNKSPVQMK